MGDALVHQVGEQAVQFDRLGRGVAQRRGHRPLDPGGAEVDGGLAQGLPDLPGEGRGGGLAVGAGHRDHHLGLDPGPAGGGDGEQAARVVGQHDRHGERAARLGLGEREALGIGQHRRRPHAQGEGDKGRPVDQAARQGGEEVPGLHPPAVDREAGDLGQRTRPVARAPRPGEEPQRLEPHQLFRPLVAHGRPLRQSPLAMV